MANLDPLGISDMTIRNLFILSILIVIILIVSYPTGKCRCYDVYGNMYKVILGAKNKNLEDINNLRVYYTFMRDKNNAFLADCIWYNTLSEEDKRNLNQNSPITKSLVSECPKNPIDNIRNKNKIKDFLRYLSCKFKSIFTDAYRCLK